jgi:hypothetical protein
MIGNKVCETRLETITIPYFKIHPAYVSPNKLIVDKEFRWSFGLFFEMLNGTAEWDFVKFKGIVSLIRMRDNIEPGKMKIEVVYSVTPNLSFKNKDLFVERQLAFLMYQAQGAWKAKNNNNSLSKIIPQGVHQLDQLKKEIQQQIYEEWV